MVCLDSDILISFLRGDKAAEEVVSMLRQGARGPLRTTVINEYELVKGARQSKVKQGNELQVRRLISGLEILDLDSEACDWGARIFNHLKEKGTMMNELDVLIGGIVLRNRETLMSRDKGFEGMPELSLEEW